MAEALTLSRERTLRSSQDYTTLRAAGLAYIQSLSGAIWTDHNLHDPGITVLELLCYALTDLGYRTGFDIRDLLEREDGTVVPAEESALFPAHEALTTTPLTLLDYRRLLLKIEGVRNAWLDPMNDPAQPGNYRESEVPIFADCVAGALSFDPTNALALPNERIRLRGLYRVLLELEIDDLLGSMNESRLPYTVRGGPLRGVELVLDSTQEAVDYRATFQGVNGVDSLVQDGDLYRAEARVQTDGGEVTLDALVLRVTNDRPRPNQPPVVVTLPDLEALLASSGAPDELLALYWQKQQQRQRAIDTVCCVLDEHRNLCEDFLSVETVQPDHVALCADIELKADADIEAVQARVYHEIEKYFNPPVSYYTLAALQEEGRCADEIFNGPYLNVDFTCDGAPVFTKPGFLKQEELEASELRRFLYVSDIINILMDFDEIIAVRNVLLRRVDAQGRPVGSGERWCLEVLPGRQPVLAIGASKILFYKNEIPYRARRTEFQKTLDHLRAMARKAAYVAPHQVLEMPRGRYRDPQFYVSIQHDLPQTYGVGEAGLSQNVPAEREAQARQLKGYLTVYDELLAGYLAQLGNVRRLFSLDRTLAQSYFARYLNQIAGTRDAFEEEFYPPLPERNILIDPLSHARLIEDESLFQERRHRLLDHLSARFAEQFTDYVMLMFDLQGDPLKTGEALIEDKIDFLTEVPVVSRERNRGFNYRPEDPARIWDTENVAGLQKRVSRLMGIDDYRRRDLACAALFDLLFSTRQVGGQFRVEVKTAGNVILFKSLETFATREAALAEAQTLFPLLRRESTFVLDDSGGTGLIRYRLVGGGVTLENDTDFETEADAVQNMRAVIDRHDEILESDAACNQEGLHLIEHLLLRPRSDQDRLFEVCLEPTCDACGDEDPYSFRVQVVLPYWPARFRNLDFRRFFENTLREECPAHIHVRVCWISNGQMALFDRRYRAWLEAKASKTPDEAALRAAADALIALLEQLKTVYPAATLHDCAEGEDENLVRLGSTNLGIF